MNTLHREQRDNNISIPYLAKKNNIFDHLFLEYQTKSCSNIKVSMHIPV